MYGVVLEKKEPYIPILRFHVFVEYIVLIRKLAINHNIRLPLCQTPKQGRKKKEYNLKNVISQAYHLPFEQPLNAIKSPPCD